VALICEGHVLVVICGGGVDCGFLPWSYFVSAGEFLAVCSGIRRPTRAG